jgi:cell division protein FtsN
MEDTSKDELMFTPEQEEASKKSPVLRYAAIGIIGIALLGASYYFSDRYVTEQRIVAQEKAQSQIEKNVQDATFDLGSLSSIDVSVAANPVEEVVLDQVYFSVIAGSFRSVENAEKKVVDLKAEGYPAALAQINPEGLYRVAYGRYTSKKEAINMLYFLKYTLEEEAWYLEER